MGYHIKEIKKGKLGNLSKIQEELDEAVDADIEGNRILLLCELADIYGALEFFLEKNFPGFSMEDLQEMSEATKRAFKSGRRN